MKDILSKTRPVLPPFFVAASRNWEIIDPTDSAEVPKFFRAEEYAQISYPFLHPYPPAKADDIHKRVNELVGEMEM